MWFYKIDSPAMKTCKIQILSILTLLFFSTTAQANTCNSHLSQAQNSFDEFIEATDISTLSDEEWNNIEEEFNSTQDHELKKKYLYWLLIYKKRLDLLSPQILGDVLWLEIMKELPEWKNSNSENRRTLWQEISSRSELVYERIARLTSNEIQEYFALNPIQALNLNEVREHQHFTLLMRATTANNTRVVSELLKIPGINVNARGSKQETALMLSINYGALGPFKKLLKVQDININAQDENGYNPLGSAARMASLETHSTEQAAMYLLMLKRLLKSPNINVNIQDQFGLTALAKSIENRSFKIFNVLINTPGIDLDIKDSGGNNYVSLAAFYNQMDILSSLLKTSLIKTVGSEINNKGETALIVAARSSVLPIVAEILKVPGVDPNQKDKAGKTAFMAAAEASNLEVLSDLLKRDGIDINAVDHNGQSAFLKFVIRHLYQSIHPVREKLIFDFLKHPGVNVTLKDTRGHSAFIVLATANHPEILEQLLKVPGANVNITDAEGKTALIIEAFRGRHESVSRLLSVKEININATDVTGRTALIWAAMQDGNTLVIDQLLKSSELKINLQDDWGSTALMMSTYSRGTEVLELLLKDPRIKLDLVNSRGQTAVMIAKHVENAKAESLLLKASK